MAWLKPANKGVEDWEGRLKANDPTLTALHVFPTRKFGHEEVERICAALKDNTSLTELSSSGHSMKPETAKLVADMLTVNTGLASLCIGDREFGDAALKELAVGLLRNTSLQKLDLEQRNVGAEGLRALHDALAASSGIRQLNLSRNPLGDAGAEVLAHSLHTLEQVDLSACGIGAKGITALSVAVAAPASRLQSLHLNSNPIGEEGAESLASAAASSPCLEELHLRDCEIGDGGAIALARAVSLSTKLRCLDLARCSITARGIAPLAEVLQQKGPLEVLRLRGNQVGDEGAQHLTKAIAVNQALHELDLGSNQLSAPAAELVIGGLHLRKLSLFDSHLGDDGAQRMAEIMAAESLTALQELELSGCRIGPPGMSALFEALQTGVAPALEVLLVAANPAAEAPGFETSVEMLQAMRPELDVAWASRAAANGATPEVETPLSPHSMPHEQPATPQQMQQQQPQEPPAAINGLL